MVAQYYELHNATEQYTLKWLIVCCMNFTLIKKKKNPKQQRLFADGARGCAKDRAWWVIDFHTPGALNKRNG